MTDKTIPAFPSGLIDPATPEDAIQSIHNGMALRDYFAAKALEGFISILDPRGGEPHWNLIAADSYKAADAMLKAREA